MKQPTQAYERWLTCAEPALIAELHELRNRPELIEDAFYRDLAFGTGGLRGVIGAGTNRMNVHTVAKASQGLSDYIRARFAPGDRSVAISYDSRIQSDVFARVSAEVFAANGLRVYIYPQLMPTPCLSFAVRALRCAAGIMVTASHNPAQYNGYKVYGPDGCQITTEAADEILAAIERLDIFDDVRRIPFDQALQKGMISWINEDIYIAFVNEVKAQTLLSDEDRIDRGVSIVYTPLNGTGLRPVLRTLKESGFTNITVVPEQEQPDGRFPTCPYPNPEIREAMELGIRTAKQMNADLLLATDPDCDRCGIAVKDGAGEYVLLTGNETGMLLLDYICRRRVALGKMPEHPVLVKTIVTIDLAEQITARYGVQTVNVLTGFKFIGETIGRLEAEGRRDDYIFGFEESYGYLSGTYVRDKDAVNAAFLICEMFAWYRQQGISLLEQLEQLYREYGYCLNTLHSFTFEGAAGFEKMQAIMAQLRSGLTVVGGRSVLETLDYAKGLDGLPPSDVLKFRLAGNASAVVRPSGTEPKLKIYISVSAADRADAQREEQKIADSLREKLA
ncbi:MAG: phospho-sugar mutase [Clostridia bacterium]|nr:phospho-sugar mutase [Clostridia bacterium]